MTPYEIPESSAQVDLDLSRNEGTPWFLDSVGTIDDLAGLANRYPRTAGLRSTIAERHKIDEHQVLVTAGGDDALFRCFLARAGRSFVTTTPTFEMIGKYGEQSGSTSMEISWQDGSFPIDDFADAAAESNFSVVVSPNNPTGQAITPSDLRRIASSSPLVVLDAAYVEFADEDLTPLALELDNVVVVRTMSKAFGLAGLRVGYLIGPADVIGEISAFGSPYPVSGISARLAEMALRSESGPRKRFVDEVRVERRELGELIERLGLNALSSQANFLLVTVRDPGRLIGSANSLGIALRSFPGRSDLANHVRISLPGRSADFTRLANVLTTIVAPECLLFDLDGVIADVSSSCRDSIIATAASFGVAVTAEEISAEKEAWKANDELDLITRLCRNSGVEVDIEEVADRFEMHYQGFDGQPGLKMYERPLIDAETLRRWKAKVPLGIVTGRSRQDANDVLERFGFDGLFDTVVTRDDAPIGPDPAQVRLALENLGARQGWMVGRTPDDLTAARLAGVLPIAVLPPGEANRYAMDAFANAAFTLNSTPQLQEILDDTQC